MGRAWVRYLIAVVFVLLVAGPYYLGAFGGWDGESEIKDWVGITLIAVVFLSTGFLVGRWWVLPLLLVPILLTLPLGVNEDDSDGWTYTWLLIWGPMLIGVPALVFGYAARIIVDAMVGHARPQSR